jgi:hypothetical protein
MGGVLLIDIGPGVAVGNYELGITNWELGRRLEGKRKYEF